jgi:hypothetical protein
MPGISNFISGPKKVNLRPVLSWSHISIFVLLTPAAVLLDGCHSTEAITTPPTITPLRAALVVSQTLSLSATTNDNAGITWKADAGTFSSAKGKSGTAITYTAPATAGVYTLTAANERNASQRASITVAVTDLGGVYTYHNDLSRDGLNAQEYALTTTTVNTATFGKLFSCSADGAIYAQPLWVGYVNIGGGKHNVIVAATMRDSVYVFDADASPCVTYWHETLIPLGETYGNRYDFGTNDIYPDIGILSTPVISRAAGTMYLVTKTKTISGGIYHQRLHALSLVDGSERTGSPVELDNSITYPGNCEGGSSIAFDPKAQNQRAGLALANGVVYIAWASHGDEGIYYGWVVGYNALTLSRVAVYNAAPNAVPGFSYCRAGIWMSGGAPAFDSSNNMYVITGNGTFDGVSDFGDSFLKLSTGSGLTRADSFTAYDQADLDSKDLDLGSGGAVILVDLPGAAAPHLLLGGGKAGSLYVLNRDNLGGYQQGSGGGDNVVQVFSINDEIFSTLAMWQNTLYIAGVGGPLQAIALNTSTGKLDKTTSQSSGTFGFPGATPAISSTGAVNGIAWAIDSSRSGTWNGGSAPAGPAVLHAYDATNLAKELWNSSMVSADTAGNAVKFTVPTIANGKVYIGTRGNDSTQGTGTIFGEVDVYGLKPN